MQRLKKNTFSKQNIQSTSRFECDCYMHTSRIDAPRYSQSKTFHIPREGSGLLPS